MSTSFLESLRALTTAKKSQSAQLAESIDVTFSDDEHSSGDEAADEVVRIAAKGRANYYGGSISQQGTTKARGEFVSLLLPDTLDVDGPNRRDTAQAHPVVRSTFAALRHRAKRPRSEDELALQTPSLAVAGEGDSTVTRSAAAVPSFVPTSFATSDPILAFEETELEDNSDAELSAMRGEAHGDVGTQPHDERERPRDVPKENSKMVTDAATTGAPKVKRSMLERARAVAEAAAPAAFAELSATGAAKPSITRAGYR